MVDSHQHGAQEIAHPLEILLRAGPRRDVLVGTRRGAEPVALRGVPGVALFGEHTARGDQLLPGVGSQLAALDGTPGIAVAVDDAVAGDGYILDVHGRDRRLAAPGVESLESDFANGIIVLIVAEEDDGVILQMQLDVVQKFDGSGVPDALGHRYATATPLREVGDGLRESLRIEGDAVARAAEIGDRNFAGGDLRQRDPLHGKGQAGINRIVLRRVVGGCGPTSDTGRGGRHGSESE